MQGEPMFESHIPTLSEKKGKKQKRKRKKETKIKHCSSHCVISDDSSYWKLPEPNNLLTPKSV